MLRDLVSTEIFTVLMLISLLLIAATKLLYPKRFNIFASVVINFKYLKLYSREQKFLDSFEALLFSNLIIGLSIFCYQLYNKTQETSIVSKALLFKIAFAIAIFILIKVLIERLISSVLNIETIISNYLFQKTSYKNFIGMLLIPINAILIYSIQPTLFVYIIIVSVLLIINCVGSLSFLKRNQNLIKNNLVYFILYLCALEISPFVILYKLVTNL